MRSEFILLNFFLAQDSNADVFGRLICTAEDNPLCGNIITLTSSIFEGDTSVSFNENNSEYLVSFTQSVLNHPHAH